jgi:ATP-dependent Clp protease ATP-binding subunit ClpA
MASGIPVNNISKDEIEKLKNLSRDIQNEIIGQDEAVSAVVKTITKNKA